MSNKIGIVFPHQLFKENPLLEKVDTVYLLEEYLFFNQYKFHKQKIAFHRGSMKEYASFLEEQGISVRYIEAHEKIADIRSFDQLIEQEDIGEVHVIDPTDNWLEKRLKKATENVELFIHDSPLFLNTRKDNEKFFRSEKSSFFQTTFYKQQRKKYDILLDNNGEPDGGQWTYDKENRKKYPKSKQPPEVHFPGKNNSWSEAIAYVEEHFTRNPGEVSSERWYPTNFGESEQWLDEFLSYRFYEFGPYEDAIVKEHSILNHSVLSPLINVGLLTPDQIIDKILAFAKKEDVPLNSTEGFVRQIIGWREFIRGMYEVKGSYSRTQNFWEFERKIPKSFYTGNTGLPPVDDAIKKVLKTGYCHHIERLMVLGNVMLLCEFHPDEVYRWFMELFIDAYDWIMVPNVYGMSQFADGGTFATKPYLSSSNYIKKMSNYSSGEWEETWDGLFWRFIGKHYDFFNNNGRTNMMCYQYDRMTEEKRQKHRQRAEQFLEELES